MDFALLHKGILSIALSTVTSLNIGLAPTSSTTPKISITEPSLIESGNLPDESKTPIQDLNSLTKTDDVNLVMVTKPEEEKLVTVEEPERMFTVLEPTPKPSVTEIASSPEETTPTRPSSKGSRNDDDGDDKKASEPSEKPSAKPSLKPEDKKAEEKKADKSPEPSASINTNVSLNSPNAEKLFRMTNDHRAKLGKAAFEKEERLCKIAENRAPQVNGELASGKLHAGFKALNLPYWATENIAAYQTIEEDFRFLVTDYIHRVAIESDHKYSCTACVGASCSQVFSSFVPK